MNQRGAFIAGMLAIAGGALLFTLHSFEEASIQPAASSDIAPRYTLLETDWTRFNGDGQPSLKGIAETMVYFSDESGQATNIIVDALDLDHGQWKLAAPTAILPPKEKRIQLLGNVDIAGQWPDNGDPLRARTDRVWIDPSQHSITTDAPVEVDSHSRAGTAVGLRADWQKKSLQLLQDVKMTYKAPTR